MKALLTRDAIRHRYHLSPERLVSLLTDDAWCERHGIRPTDVVEHRPRYDAVMAARIAHCYRETPCRHRGGSTQYETTGWRCVHCGAVLRDPYCRACEVSIGRGRDVRAVRLRRPTDASHIIGRYVGGGMEYGQIEDRVDALRHEPIEEQVDTAMGLLRRNLDRDELRFDRRPRLARQLRRLGWDGGAPWEAVVLLMRRVCGYCGHAIVGLDHVIRTDGRCDVVRLERLKTCAIGCSEKEPPPEGWQERLAELRARKRAAGETV